MKRTIFLRLLTPNLKLALTVMDVRDILKLGKCLIYSEWFWPSAICRYSFLDASLILVIISWYRTITDDMLCGHLRKIQLRI